MADMLGTGVKPPPDGGRPPNRPYHSYYVRQLMIVAAGVMLLGAPFYSNSLPGQVPLIVLGALVLVALAAATNPWKKNILTYDAIATGVGLVIYQTWALYAYEFSSALAFVLREALALIFLTAFYFSIKTVRTIILAGPRDSVDDFSAARELRKAAGITGQTVKRVSEFLYKKPHG